MRRARKILWIEKKSLNQMSFYEIFRSLVHMKIPSSVIPCYGLDKPDVEKKIGGGEL